MIKFKIEEVLIEYIEPLLVLVRSTIDRRYLCIAINEEDYSNPYLCVRVLDHQIEEIVSGDMDVKSIFVKPYRGTWFIAEMKADGGVMRKYRDSIWEVPRQHLPEAGLFVPIDDPDQKISAQINSGVIEIDGKWTPSDFQQISRSYNQIYSLAYLVENASEEAISDKVVAHPYRDGFSSMHLHRELLSNIPYYFRPRVLEVKYASPGHIAIRGQGDSLEYFRSVCKLIKERYVEVVQVYSTVYKYLSEHRLLGIDVNAFGKDHSATYGSQLDKHFATLCAVLGFSPRISAKFKRANKLGKVKYLMVYIRRIDELRELVFSEKITVR